MPRHQSAPRRQPAPRRSRVGVAVTVGVAVAVVVTAATYRSSSDREPRAQVTAPPVQAATAPPAQTPATAAPMAAATTGTPPRQAATVSAAAAAPATATVGSAGQRTYIDPVSKRIREAEHDEATVLGAIAPAQRRATRTAGIQAAGQPEYGPGGAIGMVVPEELQTFMVATRTPDGRIVMEHATGPKAAQAKTRAGASKPGTIAGKEEPNVR